MKIKETKDIDRATEIACISAFQAGKTNALDPVVRSHEKLIRATALRVKKSSPRTDIEELKSAGRIGLCDAAARFDCAREIRFSTFAVHYIRSEMISLVRNDTLVPFARGMHTKRIFYGAGKACRKLGFDAQSLTPAQAEEIAIELDVPVDTLTSTLELMNAREMESLSFIGDEDAFQPSVDAEQEAAAIASDGIAKMQAAIDRMPTRHARVVRGRFLCDPQISYENLARELAAGTEAIKSLEREGMDFLRRALADTKSDQPASQEPVNEKAAEIRRTIQARASDLAVGARAPRMEQRDRNWTVSRREAAYQLWLPGLSGCVVPGAGRPVRRDRNKGGARHAARNTETLAFSF